MDDLIGNYEGSIVIKDEDYDPSGPYLVDVVITGTFFKILPPPSTFEVNTLTMTIMKFENDSLYTEKNGVWAVSWINTSLSLKQNMHEYKILGRLPKGMKTTYKNSAELLLSPK